jgi:hypothetical protein
MRHVNVSCPLEHLYSEALGVTDESLQTHGHLNSLDSATFSKWSRAEVQL